MKLFWTTIHIYLFNNRQFLEEAECECGPISVSEVYPEWSNVWFNYNNWKNKKMQTLYLIINNSKTLTSFRKPHDSAAPPNVQAGGSQGDFPPTV